MRAHSRPTRVERTSAGLAAMAAAHGGDRLRSTSEQDQDRQPFREPGATIDGYQKQVAQKWIEALEEDSLGRIAGALFRRGLIGVQDGSLRVCTQRGTAAPQVMH
mmetsp:Transcript_110192/g.343553  ORF Transcript_110192/g.343553 Transcript_110192/m.343553 type:complete len:105 (+) Transcript_110192:65-379(+)